MRFKFIPHILAVFVCSLAVCSLAVTAYSQAEFSGRKYEGLPISVGAGASLMNNSFNDGLTLGDHLWIDIAPPLPGPLEALGVEIEGEQIGITKPATEGQQREEIAAAGLTYTFRTFRNIRRFEPQVKFLEGLGNAEYVPHGLRFNQDRDVRIAGGGFIYPLTPVLCAHVDYEYQWWPDFWVTPPTFTTGAALTPSGVTIGFTYQISPFRRHF